MRIADILWLKEIIEKLAWKHDVTVEEVEEVIWNRPHFRFVTKGQRNRNEDLYVAHGQTYAGRYLSVFFIYKDDNTALIISARNMDDKERKLYGRR